MLHFVVNARRSDKLRNNNTFRAVNNESSAWGHSREFAHVNLLLFHIACFFIGQTCCDIKGCGISRVAQLALFDCVLWLIIDAKINKFEKQITCVIHNS